MPGLNFRENEETENPKLAKTTKPNYFSSARIGTLLNYRDHPFFKDISRITEEHKSFYNRVLAIEGDIFKRFVFDWAPIKKVILEVIFHAMSKLQTFCMDVLDNIVSKVASMVAAAEKMGIRVVWTDKVFGEIGAKRHHFGLVWEAQPY